MSGIPKPGLNRILTYVLNSMSIEAFSLPRAGQKGGLSATEGLRLLEACAHQTRLQAGSGSPHGFSLPCYAVRPLYHTAQGHSWHSTECTSPALSLLFGALIVYLGFAIFWNVSSFFLFIPRQGFFTVL